MRPLKLFIALFVAIVIATSAGVNAQGSGNDRPLEQQIYKRLLYLPEVGVFDYVTFELQGGTVTLNGKVASFGTKNDAARSVKGLPGVTEVVNNIEQLPASPSDDQIRRHALMAFTNQGPSQYFSDRAPDVRIIVENGRLTLEGYVTSKSHAEWLNTLANGIPGVFSVQNNLIVGRDTNR
jgi:osmotically-inducible protein OsmY